MPAGSAAPLNILQLTFQGDGAGSTQSIFNLSDHLRRRGHRVILGVRDESLLARMGREAGLAVIPLDFRRLSPLASRLAAASALLALSMLGRVLVELDPTSFHLWMGISATSFLAGSAVCALVPARAQSV